MATLLDQGNTLATVLANALKYIGNMRGDLWWAGAYGPAVCQNMSALVPAHSADLAAIAADLASVQCDFCNIEFLRRLQLDSAPFAAALADLTAIAPAPWVFNASPALPAGATLARASTAWTFGSTGVLTPYANDVPRFPYDPATLALRGVHNEPPAINSVPDNSAVGAVAGTPGTQPTGWSTSGTANGVTRTIAGPATEDGIPYVSYKFTGTPSSSGSITLSPTANNALAGSSGQTWVASWWVSLTAGSFTNVGDMTMRLIGRNDAGAAQENSATSIANGTSAALRTQRFNVTRMLNAAGTTKVQTQLQFSYTSGNPIDFTIRMGMPQLVQAPAPSSSILTTTGAVPRAADVLTLATLPGTYDVVLARESGTTVLPAQVVGATFAVPTDPSPLQSVNLAWPGV